MIKKIVLGLLLIAYSLQPLCGEKLKKINITGLHRVEVGAVEDYITVKRGDDIDDERLENSLKRLYQTNWFSDIKFDVKGETLNVKVVENPTINQVAFEGNDSVSDDILKGEVAVKSRQIFNESVVKRETQKILEIYKQKGRYTATVEPKIIKHDQNRVDVVFLINEGTVSNIQKINFVGVNNFSQDDLESAIYSKESRFYRFLTATDTYDPERLEGDKYALKKFYAKNGYINCKIISAGAQLLQDKSGFYLTFLILDFNFLYLNNASK
jgi:outer membrane protein insertion porin family